MNILPKNLSEAVAVTVSLVAAALWLSQYFAR